MRRFSVGAKVTYNGKEGTIEDCDLPVPGDAEEILHGEQFYLVSFDDGSSEQVAECHLVPSG